MHKGFFMLTILHTESSTGCGGQEIQTLQECLGMLSRGYRVIIAAPGKSKIYERHNQRESEPPRLPCGGILLICDKFS